MFVQTTNVVQILNNFPGSKTGLMSKTPFTFDEYLWFGADNLGTNFLLPIAQLITIAFYDQWSSSEVKISGKPRFK